MATLRVTLDSPRAQNIIQTELEGVSFDWATEKISGFIRQVDSAGSQRISDRFELDCSGRSDRDWFVGIATTILQKLQTAGEVDAGNIAEE
jgi:hypothetical protein